MLVVCTITGLTLINSKLTFQIRASKVYVAEAETTKFYVNHQTSLQSHVSFSLT